jgi:hypothetical protein
MLMGEWLGRYSRRRDTLNGTYGRLADAPGVKAVLARQQTLDAEETMLPEWDPAMQAMIDLCYQNNANGLDVKSPVQPHRYGPSLRRLWSEAKRKGNTDDAAWDHVVAWARRRPAALQAEDQRKKKGLAYAALALGEHLARETTWLATRDVAYPWAANVNGECWRVRINDFPDDFMYSLAIDGRVVGDFHDWPEIWRRASNLLESKC